ncbi:type II secretion system protein GspM [Phenylobacterium sp.]|jgi:general secretion pathway protein M|uniref:type II secretion system protein GspM n=1 Tax=Phenylobacterium sp. TaxID=1871053 RepID=UPI002E2EAAF8|nr:type II secretion system protein GspM [Phenylobacterium sp.]HEX2558750.1 type II secretion system protein GspM [Phenylobacterium sp.]
MRWWSERSGREKALLGVMGAAVGAFGLWYGLYAPLLAVRERALERHDAALVTQAEVGRAVARIRGLQARAAAPAASTSPEEAVAATAMAAGISLARTEPDPEGGLRVAADAVSATALFPWLGLLQREHGLAARNLTVVKGEGGGLRLDATLARP